MNLNEDKYGREIKAWHELYIEFKASPFDNRTDTQFCKDVVISPSTLCAWKLKYNRQIFEEVSKRRKEYVNELRVTAYKELVARMKKDTNGLKLAFQVLGDLVEKTEQRVEYTNPDDTKRRISLLLENISNKQKNWGESDAKTQSELPSIPEAEADIKTLGGVASGKPKSDTGINSSGPREN